MKVGLVWGQSWRERGAEDALQGRDRAGPSATKHEECVPVSQWVLGLLQLRGHGNQGWPWGGSWVEVKGSGIGIEVGHTLGWRGMDHVLGRRVTVVWDRGAHCVGKGMQISNCAARKAGGMGGHHPSFECFVHSQAVLQPLTSAASPFSPCLLLAMLHHQTQAVREALHAWEVSPSLLPSAHLCPDATC